MANNTEITAYQDEVSLAAAREIMQLYPQSISRTQAIAQAQVIINQAIQAATAELPEMLKLLQALADQYTGRNPLALLDTNDGQWAEEILAKIQNREPEEPK